MQGGYIQLKNTQHLCVWLIHIVGRYSRYSTRLNISVLTSSETPEQSLLASKWAVRCGVSPPTVLEMPDL